MSRPKRLLFRSLPLLLLASVISVPASAQQGSESRDVVARDAWMTLLSDDARGTWVASNAIYQEEDGGGDDLFGIDWELLPGGLASRGCLWGTTGDVDTPYWRFTMYWDPTEAHGVIVQTSGSGAIAIGVIDPTQPPSAMKVQTLFQPTGAPFQIGHTAEFPTPDIRLDYSWRRAMGAEEWNEGRTYRWERKEKMVNPC